MSAFTSETEGNEVFIRLKFVHAVQHLIVQHRDNYGFVTFAYKVDAYEAVEHGNDDPNLPKYDLSFGGRRAFCKEQYADLGEPSISLSFE
jgi:hypothetical protein